MELYANFILNKSVEKQFNAFAEGFQLLCQDSAINVSIESSCSLLNVPDIHFVIDVSTGRVAATTLW